MRCRLHILHIASFTKMTFIAALATFASHADSAPIAETVRRLVWNATHIHAPCPLPLAIE